jgi:hypothetical protein
MTDAFYQDVKTAELFAEQETKMLSFDRWQSSLLSPFPEEMAPRSCAALLRCHQRQQTCLARIFRLSKFSIPIVISEDPPLRRG